MFIEKTRGICGGRARLRGTSTPVWVIFAFWAFGRTRESLEAEYGKDGVNAALAYTSQHTQEIERDLIDHGYVETAKLAGKKRCV